MIYSNVLNLIFQAHVQEVSINFLAVRDSQVPLVCVTAEDEMYKNRK